MADEPINTKGLTSETAESNRLAAQGNEHGRQEVDISTKAFALQRLASSKVLLKMQAINEEQEKSKKSLSESFTSGYQNMVESLHKTSLSFSNVGGALKQDFGKLGLAFAPLTSIPGVETVLTIIKGTLAKLFLLAIKNVKLSKAREKFANLRAKGKDFNNRRKQLNAGIQANVKRDAGGGRPKAGKIRNLALFGIIAITAALRGFIAGLLSGISSWLKLLGFTKLSSSFTKGSQKLIKSTVKSIRAFTARFTTFSKGLGMLSGASKTFKAIGGIVRGALKTVTKFAFALGKLFYPIKVIYLIYTGVMGMIDGFKKYSDAGWINGIAGGLIQGIADMGAFILGWPLDLFKWIFSKFIGFAGVDTSTIDAFSFQDSISEIGTALADWVSGFITSIKTAIADIGIMGLIKNMALNLFKVVMKIINFPKAVMAGAGAAIAAAWPGGETPGEAFMRKFNSVFTANDAIIDSMKTKADGMDEDGNVLEKSTSANDAQNDTGTGKSPYYMATSNTVVNNTAGNKNYVASTPRAADPAAHHLAYSQ